MNSLEMRPDENPDEGRGQTARVAGCELATALAGRGKLLAQTEFLDECRIRFASGVGEVAQQAISLADHEEETAAPCVILGVGLEMSLERIDSLSQNCNLDFG